MQWSEFYPYVTPYVAGCPYPTIDHHLKLAAIEFCRRTACHQATMDAVNTDGTVYLALEPNTGTLVNRVLAVAVNGRSWPLVDSKQGLQLVRCSSTQDFCFTQDNRTLQIYPLQLAGVPVVVDAAMVPTFSATSLDDVVGQTYLSDIANGAIASIQMVPGHQFTEPGSAAARSTAFNSRIATVAAKVARGFLPAKVRSHTSYL